MYEYIQGPVVDINPTQVVIEAGGVGYSIHISLNTYSALHNLRESKIFIHFVVREDAQLLYGFATTGERELFRQLLSVNGVGAATALMMLSSLSPDELVTAISTDNINLLKSVKGIGLKTAQRIVIDLKDKIAKVAAPAGEIPIQSGNTLQIEALSALVMLGFNRKDAEKVLDGIVREQPGLSVELMIKHALKRL